MGPDHTSYDFLAHFDRPKTVDSPDFEWVDEVLPNSSPVVVSCQPTPPALSGDAAQLEAAPPQAPRHGVQWVLQWAAALAVLAFAGSILVEFTYLLVAEHELSIAARAGALEATLPRATPRSVMLVVQNHLTRYPRLAKHLQLTVLQNGSPAARQFRHGDGDRISVRLSASSNDVLPDWLRIMMLWRGDTQIRAYAERQIPGRKLVHD
ncbi:MAG TPA: hypothetical protein VHE81_03535 [Lacipirellulaceae bacterium]|nr:hypothetical protein [Lacipirellulaceae bacterium]